MICFDVVDDVVLVLCVSDVMVELCDGDDGVGVVSGVFKSNDSYVIEKWCVNMMVIVGMGLVV